MTRNLLLCLIGAAAVALPAEGMSTYKDYWVSGATLYSSASTDTDGVDETASADIRIYGPSGSSSTGYNCTWYYANVVTSLGLTTGGDHTVESNHWTQSISALRLLDKVEYTHGVEVNYAYNGNGGIDWCSYDVSCPGSGGGSSPICTNAPSSITLSKSPSFPCGSGPYKYGFVEYLGAVKLPILTNRICIVEEARGTSNVQHACTAP